MRDISTMVRDYYDTAAVPVTAAEAIAHTAADDDRRPVPNWVLAVAVAVVVIVVLGGLSFLLGGSEGSVEPAGPGLETTVTTNPLEPASTMLSTPAINARWTLEATLDEWLTEPVLVNGNYYATHKGLDDDAQPNEDGLIEGRIEEGGELWTSLNGVTWTRADESGRTPRTSPGTRSDGVEVVVRRDPTADLFGMLVAEGLWATSNGTSWREIALRPSQNNWIPWVETGDFGWVVYSPPREATVEADGSSAFEGPRHGNLGLWYTPDTETWFEVTDLGPLADAIHNLGEIATLDAAMIVRDTDILVYAHIAKSGAYGIVGNPHTEIWRLELSPGEPAEAFDFLTEDLCEWFSPEEIQAIIASTYMELGVPLDPTDQMQQMHDENSDCYWAYPLVSLSVDASRVPSGPFESHPTLNESVQVSYLSDGSYGLMFGVDVILTVEGHSEQLSFGHATSVNDLGVDVPTVNTLGLTIANKMLQQMGWIGTD